MGRWYPQRLEVTAASAAAAASERRGEQAGAQLFRLATAGCQALGIAMLETNALVLYYRQLGRAQQQLSASKKERNNPWGDCDRRGANQGLEVIKWQIR